MADRKKTGNSSKSVRRPGRIRKGLYLFAGIAWVLGMSAGLIFAYDLVTQTDYFAADRIEIVGNHRLSDQEIVGHAALKPGVNIYSINLFLLRKRLQAHPWVGSATVTRKAPNRLTIQIVEHVPLALIDMGRMFILDTNGELFKENAGTDRLRLPVVHGLTYADIQATGHPEADPFQAVMTVLKLGQTPGSVLSNRRIRRIQVDRKLGLTLYTLGDAAAIKLGYADYPEKYRRLEKVLAFCRSNETFTRLRFIDLNNVNRIVVRPARAEETGDDPREA